MFIMDAARESSPILAAIGVQKLKRNTIEKKLKGRTLYSTRGVWRPVAVQC